MTITDRLRIIGRTLIGREEEAKQESPKKTKGLSVLGGFFDIGTTRLSNYKTVSEKVLLANTGWVYRNNDTIAQEVSKIDFELYTVGLSNGEIVYNEVVSHPLLDLLDKPNAEVTKSDAIYTIQSHKKLTGDAFWLKIRTNGVVTSLRTLPPDKVSLILRAPTENDPTVIQAYHYEDTIDGQTVKRDYDPKDIIHFKKPNPNNPFRGLGAVEALADTIDLDNLTTETTKQFFKNGAITNFVLSTDAKVNDDQLRRLKAEMKQTSAGVNNAYKAMILGGGLKPVDISYSNKELEFLAQLEWYRDKIMYGFGNTKASMGMVDDVNRASHQGSIIEWQRNTVKPDMEAIVNALNEFLVPEFGSNLVLGFVDPVPEDQAQDIQEIEALYPIGVITLNEARELANFDKLEDESGDEFYSAPTPVIQEPASTNDGNSENEKPDNPKPDEGGNE